MVTNDLVEMFIQMYGHEIVGPRIPDYFRNACLLLMDQPEGGTIVDIMRLFTDEAFAEAKIRNLKLSHLSRQSSDHLQLEFMSEILSVNLNQLSKCMMRCNKKRSS